MLRCVDQSWRGASAGHVIVAPHRRAPRRGAPEGPSVHGTFYQRVFALVTGGALALLLFRILEPFTGAILWSLLLAVLLHPAQKALGRLGGRTASRRCCSRWPVCC